MVIADSSDIGSANRLNAGEENSFSPVGQGFCPAIHRNRYCQLLISPTLSPAWPASHAKGPVLGIANYDGGLGEQPVASVAQGHAGVEV
jgi:hypothetical protein